MKKIKNISIRIIALMLVIIQLSSCIVFADNKKSEVKASVTDSTKVYPGSLNYLLAVSSGEQGCSGVDKIIVKYTGTDNISYTQVLNPSADKASSYDTTSKTYYGALSGTYSYTHGQISTADQNANKNILKSIYHCTDDVMNQFMPAGTASSVSKSDLFENHSTEYLYFEAFKEIKEVTEIDIIFLGDSQDWVLKDLCIYKLAKDNITLTANNYAFYSTDQFISFEGCLLTYYMADYHKDLDTYATEITFSKTFDMVRFVNKKPLDAEDGTIYYLLQTPDTYSSDSALNTRNITFKINISDNDGSGIDSLTAYEKDASVYFREVLYANISYTDINGIHNTFSVPVVSNCLMTFLQTEAAGKNKSLTSTDAYKALTLQNGKSVKMFAQDGSGLVFNVDIPEYKSIDSISIMLSNTEDTKDVLKIDNIEVYSDSTDFNNRYKSLYNRTASGSVDVINMDVDTSSIYGRELILVSDALLDGSELTSNNKYTDFSLTDNLPDNEENQLLADNYYLVTIKTADLKNAGTGDSVYISFDYIDTQGLERKTDEYNLSSLAKELYGTNYGVINGTNNLNNRKAIVDNLKNKKGWVVAEEKDLYRYSNNSYVKTNYSVADVNYATHMTPGASISFPVAIDSLDTISKINLSMKNATDQWQIDSISIDRLESMGEKIISYVGEQEIDGISYRFVTEREPVTGENIFSNYDMGVLVQNNDTVEIDITTGETSSEVTSRDFTDYYYGMSYDLAKSDLRLSTISKTYEVRVSVSSNVGSGVSDDGTGSNNLFYFQLVFEKGTSGVVLANSQLTSDGFRAGTEEVFYISTTEDFGDVTAVRIIPDDLSEDSSKLDKLCIDKITVVENQSNARNRIYTVSTIGNKGWINMEYVDSGNIASSKGRSLSEIATVGKVSSTSYVSTLEFCIAYGDFDGSSALQFVGDIYANIVYTDSDGKRNVLKDVSLAKNMYDFSRRTAQTDVTANTTYVSDPDTMFRPNTIDRFYVDFENIASINQITLTGIPKNNAKVKINAISVNLVESEGVLKLNSNDEYQYIYSTDSTFIVDKDLTEKDPYEFPANQEKSYIFTFEDNTIGDSDSSYADTIKRLPASEDDELNLFIYMKKSDDNSELYTVSPKNGNYILKTHLLYSSASTGYCYDKYITDYDEETVDDQIVLSKYGISTKYLTNINNIEINAPDDAVGAYIDHAVIQHIRANTVIDTIYVNFTGTDAASRYGVYSLANRSMNDVNERQRVTLLLDEDSPAMSLSAEEKDIAVSINYSVDIPGYSNDTNEFNSENVFLSDSNKLYICGGTLCTFDFSEYGVDKINSITVTASNGAKCIIKSAIIETYVTEDDTELRTSYMSINPTYPVAVELTAAKLNINQNYVEKFNSAINNRPSRSSSLKIVQFTFNTMDYNDTYEDGAKVELDSNGEVPIAMNIVYVDSAKNLKTVYVEDIRDICVKGGGFGQGESATINLMLPGIERISYIQLLPTQNDGDELKASWNLKDITYSISDTSYSKARTINIYRKIYESDSISAAEQINLSPITVELETSGLGQETSTVRNGSLSLNGESGDVLNIKINIDGGISKNYCYRIEQAIDDSRQVITDKTTGTGSTLAFTLPDNDTQQNKVYVIRIWSAETTAVYSEVYVTVPPRSVAD